MVTVADLSNASIKFNRADEHLGALKTETLKWIKPYTEGKFINFGRDGEWHTVNSIPGQPPDPTIGAIAGDFIHNLRCVLDYIVWQAVLREGEGPDGYNFFPIYERPADFKGKVKVRKRKPEEGCLHGIPIDGDAWTIIEKAQPYNRTPADPFRDPLAVLQRLSNADKHRALPPQFLFADQEGLVRSIGWRDDVALVEQSMVLHPRALEQPTELIRFRFAPSDVDPGMYVKGKVALRPTFGEQGAKARTDGPIPGRRLMYGTQAPIFGGTDLMVRAVRGVVESFAALPRVVGWEPPRPSV